MKKKLMTIPYLFLWIFYFFLTTKERTEYMMAEEKGMGCIGSHDDSFLIPGNTTKYYFDPNSKPERHYSTWKEFWQMRGYYNNSK